MPAETLDSHDKIMDNAKPGYIQISLLVLCTLVTAPEGLDRLAIAFAALVTAKEWSISPEALGILPGAGPSVSRWAPYYFPLLGIVLATILTIFPCIGISTLLSGFAQNYT